MISKLNARVLGVTSALLLSFVAGSATAAVDEATYAGSKLYKRERCETCHGATGEGSAAFPNLLNSLKNLTKEQFVTTVLNGRNAMPPYSANKKVADGIDSLYTYLKGRSDGTVPAGDLEAPAK